MDLISPLKGLTRPLKGLIWPLKGLIRPLKGLIRPFKGLIRPLKGVQELPTPQGDIRNFRASYSRPGVSRASGEPGVRSLRAFLLQAWPYKSL